MHTLGVEEGEVSLEPKEEPDFLLMRLTFLTDVERGGAGGGMSPSEAFPPPPLPPPALPLTKLREDCEVRLTEPVKTISYISLLYPMNTQIHCYVFISYTYLMTYFS